MKRRMFLLGSLGLLAACATACAKLNDKLERVIRLLEMIERRERNDY
jgi:hypothetical protein